MPRSKVTGHAITLFWVMVIFLPTCWEPTEPIHQPEDHCSDGVMNQGETGIDCGGSCDACDPSCEDGLQNQFETGIDCGGPCPACENDKIWVGNITQGATIPGDFASYWTQITPENEGKWGSVERTKDNLNWSRLDEIYHYAKAEGIAFKQHTFVWGNQQPSWIHSLPAAEQAVEVEEWIQQFCSRYPDTNMIDVVNEPDHAPPPYKQALGGAGSSGYDWIIWSFEKAREHCPGAILILNDYNVLRWDTDNFIKIAEVIHNRGLLDAIGCQAHGLESQDIQELNSNLNKVAQIGVPVYISEYDVNIANDARQLVVFQEQFPLFYSHPSVAGITLWGYKQGQTWKPEAKGMRIG